MHLVGLGEDHELLDGLVLDLVVVGLAAEAEGGLVHVDVEPTSVGWVSSALPAAMDKGTDRGTVAYLGVR